jgi:hypothetical protein
MVGQAGSPACCGSNFDSNNLTGEFMKTAVAAVMSLFVLVSAPAFAMSHGGAKMDDKKVDCTKAENKDKKECQPAPAPKK